MKKVELDKLTLDALEWQRRHSPEHVMAEREAFVSSLEEAGKAMWVSGAAANWYSQSDGNVKHICKNVNGLLLQHLTAITEHGDPHCVEFFRHGAPFIGVLPQSGNGVPVEHTAVKSIDELWDRRRESNAALLKSLKEDVSSEALFAATVADAEKGRMSEPVRVSDANVHDVLLSPRFAVPQLKADGRVAIRPIDHYSWCDPECLESGPGSKKRKQKLHSVNGHCVASEKLSHDHLDKLMLAVTAGMKGTKSSYGLWKVIGVSVA